MPRLETDVKLDFKDVLIRPKRSTLKSRSQVSLERTYSFRNSKRTWTGIPIMAANMYVLCSFVLDSFSHIHNESRESMWCLGIQ